MDLLVLAASASAGGPCWDIFFFFAQFPFFPNHEILDYALNWDRAFSSERSGREFFFSKVRRHGVFGLMRDGNRSNSGGFFLKEKRREKKRKEKCGGVIR